LDNSLAGMDIIHFPAIDDHVSGARAGHSAGTAHIGFILAVFSAILPVILSQCTGTHPETVFETEICLVHRDFHWSIFGYLLFPTV
jgi:hypothetical protein